MQHGAIRPAANAAWITVEPIPENRHPLVGEMYADLVKATGEGVRLDRGRIPMGRQDAKARPGSLATFRDGPLPLSSPAEGWLELILDDPGRPLGRPGLGAGDGGVCTECSVGLFYLAFGEKSRHRRMNMACLAEEHDARSSPVDSVGHAEVGAGAAVPGSE